EIKLTKQALSLPQEAFFVDPKVREVFAAAGVANERRRQRWLAEMQGFAAKAADKAKAWQSFRARAVPADLYQQLIAAAGPEPAATRVLSANIIQKAAELVPSLVGGSADLDPSTKTRIKKSTSFSARDRKGRVLHFGIREHAMGAILNGMTLHGGFLPMGSTFLVFADYMRPPIRLAALMKIPSTFVFTHDSLMVGEDGPTHEPVEQLTSLRLIPNLHVYRPADGIETAAAWTHALTRRDGPVVLALTRQNLPKLPRADTFDRRLVQNGGYVLREVSNARATVIATGAEVSLAIDTAVLLAQQGLELRVVSMPCAELFLQQDAAYRAAVLGKAPVFTLEMGRSEWWCQFTGRLDRCIGQNTYGASAPYKKLSEFFGFVPAKVAERIKAAL
ncbi:MAG TPA: transketolase C-terminal domain-containing protein, partial [Planctomycetota bacterium]|nr:transketolase C-terminal domain-containing protein [Planctomycetota bacterium]